MLRKLIHSVYDEFCYVLGTLGSILDIGVKAPVFIVGTGRCGTSLLVRILRSHHDITVFPGEANHLFHPLLSPLDKLENNQLGVSPIEIDPAQYTRTSVENWPSNQGRRIVRIFRGHHTATGMRRVFVVKSAAISFMIPKLCELFPGCWKFRKWVAVFTDVPGTRQRTN